MLINKILRWPDVHNATGLSRSTVWRLIRAGKFPASVKITDHATGWRQSDIEAWLAARQPAAA